jgi:hypothetical protein
MKIAQAPGFANFKKVLHDPDFKTTIDDSRFADMLLVSSFEFGKITANFEL